MLRPRSQRDAPRFKNAAHRHLSAGAFVEEATAYDRIRPAYLPRTRELLGRPHAGLRIHDLGCGTGKFLSLWEGSDAHLSASDPSTDMLRVCRVLHPEIPLWRGVAEHIPLPDSSLDVLTCAQTWHWVDTARACQEADRVLAPGGQLLLAWNTIDVSEPWVLRLARIMHSGDIQREGFLPELVEPFEVRRTLRTRWSTEMSPANLHALTHTRSYWLRSPEHIRQRVTDNLNWYLFEHLGFEEDSRITLPYRLDAFLVERAG